MTRVIHLHFLGVQNLTHKRQLVSPIIKKRLFMLILTNCKLHITPSNNLAGQQKIRMLTSNSSVCNEKYM